MGRSTHHRDSKLTYEDYALIPDDGLCHEIIGGYHCVNPAPNVNHQEISKRLLVQLFHAIDEADLGRCFAAPIDVQLSEHDVVQPDLVVLCRDNLRILTSTKIEGSPDLVIEILSPQNPKRDTRGKKKLYERAGVLEYWIIDPAEHTVEVFILESTGYVTRPASSTTITLQVLPGVCVDLMQLWKRNCDK